MATRLQIDIKGCALSLLSSGSKGKDFSMGLSGIGMKSLSNDPIALHNDRANQRVRSRLPQRPLCQFQAALHYLAIEFTDRTSCHISKLALINRGMIFCGRGALCAPLPQKIIPEIQQRRKNEQIFTVARKNLHGKVECFD
jgi:hypothetical protein